MGTRFARVHGWIRKLPGWIATYLFIYGVDRMLTPYIPFFPIRLLLDAVVLFAASIALAIMLALILPKPSERRSSRERPGDIPSGE